MPRYQGYGIVDATQDLGVVEAPDKESAEAEFSNRLTRPSVCNHCARKLNVGEVIRIEVEEADTPPSNPTK